MGHRGGDLRLSQVHEVAQDERFALPVRQPPERGEHVPVLLPEDGRLLGRFRVERAVVLIRPALQPGLTAQLGPAPVHHGGAHAGQRVARIGQLMPLAEQPAECILHGVLGGGPAPQHDRGDPDQVHSVNPVKPGDLIRHCRLVRPASWRPAVRPAGGRTGSVWCIPVIPTYWRRLAQRPVARSQDRRPFQSAFLYALAAGNLGFVNRSAGLGPVARRAAVTISGVRPPPGTKAKQVRECSTSGWGA
jgi:hypothetical protein